MPVAPQAGRRSRRALLGLTVLACAAVAALAAVLYARDSAPSYAQGPGRFLVVESSYQFSPSHMTWRVGQQVTLVLENRDSGQPPTNHEFMMGRRPRVKQTPFQSLSHPGGFQVDFFAGTKLRISRARDVEGFFHPLEPVAGPAASSPFVKLFKMPMPGPGLMPMPPNLMAVLSPGGTIAMSFTVPDRPGRWEIGCFEGDGQHFENGMRGVVDVVRS